MSDTTEALRAMLEAWEEQFGEGACDCQPEPQNAGHVCQCCKARAALAQQAATPTDAVKVFEEAMLQSWRMIDPLCPAGQPGSYARGQDAGIAAALKTVRENFERLLAARQAATPAPAEPVAIDYDALIAYCSKKYRWAQGTPRCSAFAKGAEWMRDQIAAPPATPAAQPAETDGWIAVTARLPYSEAENGERVLVCTAEHDFAGVQFHDIKATDFFEVDEDGRMGTEVTEVATHWRPRVLPSAPSTAQEAE